MKAYVSFVVIGQLAMLVCGGANEIFSTLVSSDRWWDGKFIGLWPDVIDRNNTDPVDDVDLLEIINATGGTPLLPYSGG